MSGMFDTTVVKLDLSLFLLLLPCLTTLNTHANNPAADTRLQVREINTVASVFKRSGKMKTHLCSSCDSREREKCSQVLVKIPSPLIFLHTNIGSFVCLVAQITWVENVYAHQVVFVYVAKLLLTCVITVMQIN